MLAENDIRELSRQIESQAIEIGHTLTGLWTVQTRTRSTSVRIGRSRTSTSWNSYQKYSWDGRIEVSSRITSRWVFERQNDRRSKHCKWTHGQNTGIAKWSQLYEWCKGFQGRRICTQWTIITRSQSTGVVPKPSWRIGRNAKPRSKPATRHMESARNIGKRFAGLHANASRPNAGMLKSWDSDATGNIPVQAGTEEPVAESGDQSHDTIPTPRFLRRPSGKDSFNPIEGKSLKKYGADQQRLELSELHFDKFPSPQTFSCWKISLKTEVCSCSDFLTEAMLWIKEVEMVNSVDDLELLCSVRGTYSVSLFRVARREDCISLE